MLISDRVNGVHRDFETDLAPIEIGPVTVVLTSPTHSLEVFEHELSLAPGEGGAEMATLRARYQGQAHLVADLEVAGMSSEIDDNIELPLQETEVTGLVEIVRVEDGYRVTALEAPSHVEIQVESDLAGGWGSCAGALRCWPWGTSIARRSIRRCRWSRCPCRNRAKSSLSPDEDLTEQERGQIDKVLRARQD